MKLLGTGLMISALVEILLAIILIYLIPVIAGWKLFKKAGIAGWKSLIPIYNLYLIYKISGMSGLWVLPLFVVACFSGIVNSGIILPLWSYIIMGVFAILAIIGRIMFFIKLPKAFGKGVGYIIAMFFIPGIIEIVLGFGKAEYVGEYKQ